MIYEFKRKRLKLSDLVDDAAGEEGGRFLTVRVEVERHQSVWPHGEVVVHGQNLRGGGTCSKCFRSVSVGLNHNNISAGKDAHRTAYR